MKIKVGCKSIGKPSVSVNQIPESISVENLRVRFNALALMDVANDTISIDVLIEYLLSNDIIYSAKVQSVYFVEDLKSQMTIEETNQKLEMNTPLLEDLFVISFNSARGTVALCLDGTPLEQYPFPIIFKDELLKRCRVQIAS